MEFEWGSRRSDGAVLGTVSDTPQSWELKGTHPKVVIVLHEVEDGWRGVFWPRCGWDAHETPACDTLEEAKAVAMALFRINS